MRAWMLAFALGICLALNIPELPPFNMLWAVLASLLLVSGCRTLPLVGAYVLGLAWCLFQLQSQQQILLPKALEQEDIWVQGRIAELPQKRPSSTRFRFQVEALCLQAAASDCQQWQPWPRLLRLNDYEGLNLHPGEFWQLQVRLKRPHGFANPGTFDYEAWLWTQGFNATGYIRTHEENQRLESAGKLDFQHWRGQLRERLQRISAEQKVPLQQLSLILALVIGDLSAIGQDAWQLFSLAGVNHLMVISGLHVGLVSMLAYHFSHWLWCRSCFLMYCLPAPRFAALMAVMAAGVYSGLAGFSLPTQRAWVMVTCFMWGRLVLRQIHSLDSLCLSLGLLLVLNPLAPLSSGFWLSFGAVALLLGFAVSNETYSDDRSSRSGLTTYLYGSLRAQYVLLCGLSPILMIHFQQLSLVAPLVNLFSIPLVGLLVVPLCLTAVGVLFISESVAIIPLRAADLLLDGFMMWLHRLNEAWPELLLQLPALHWFGLMIIILAALLLLLPSARRYRWLALLGLLPFLRPLDTRPEEGALHVYVMDVGQGLGMVLTTHEQTWIYDTGPAYSERFDAGSGLILAFLRAYNLGPIDGMIVSHGDNDHAGGLAALRSAYPDAILISGEPERLGHGAKGCTAGQNWLVDAVKIRVLHPSGTIDKGNNASCVVQISVADRKILLTGDIEAHVERRLLAQQSEYLSADILIAPHHGSKTSSSRAFINAVRPTQVIISSGYLNRFGHPHPDVMAGYQAVNAQAFNTALSGAIFLSIDSQGNINVEEYRKSQPRVWR